MAATQVGRILLLPKGSYSGSATYNMLDWVRDGGAAWVCKVDGTVGIAPPTYPVTSNANWELLAADGSAGGTIPWNNVSNKPFNTLGAGVKKASDNSLTLEIGTNLLLGSKLDVDVQSTYNSTGTKPINGTGVKDALDTVQNGTTINTFSGVETALSDKADDTDLDSFTTSTVCYADSSEVKVAFDNLNKNYGYFLCFDDQDLAFPNPIPTAKGDPTKTAGTTAGTIKLTYTLQNATAGTHKFALRIFK